MRGPRASEERERERDLELAAVNLWIWEVARRKTMLQAHRLEYNINVLNQLLLLLSSAVTSFVLAKSNALDIHHAQSRYRKRLRNSCFFFVYV